ncbi:MAG: hypothetical protein QF666_10580, partial [Alphaproteobacteria bacterium]|nr:hypothetical protein [Alphaproteobacteria bacterium]
MRNFFCLFALLPLLLAAPAFAGFDEGVAAYKQRDYEAALSEIRPLAEQGHAEAQHFLGKMYRLGDGVAKDYAEAVKWHRKAAEQGYLPAVQWLVGLYYWGNPLNDVPRDYAETIKWLRIAAEQGVSDSQASLGHMYFIGAGTPANPIEALRWFLAAAMQEHVQARLNISRMYFDGDVVEQDFVQSLMWLELSNAPTESYPTQFYKDLVERLTAEQIAEAEKLAREWTPAQGEKLLAEIENRSPDDLASQAPSPDDIAKRYPEFDRQEFGFLAHQAIRPFVEQGNARAKTILAIIYAEGLGAPRDLAEAAQLYRSAARFKNEAQAQNNLGYMFSRGLGQKQDYYEAVYWYQLAARQGHAWAQNNLGVMYEHGLGVRRDPSEAAIMYREAAEQGLAVAQASLALLYAQGRGVRQDYAEAVKWYRKAAEQGDALIHPTVGDMYIENAGAFRFEEENIEKLHREAEEGRVEARARLGSMYALGRGVEQDFVQALMWSSLAVAQGDKGAREIPIYLVSAMSGEQINEAERLVRKRGEVENLYVRIGRDGRIALDGQELRTLDDYQRSLAAAKNGNLATLERDDNVSVLGNIRILAEQGFSDAQILLGVLHLSDLRMSPRNSQEAKWLRSAAAQGNEFALDILAEKIIDGRIHSIDHVEQNFITGLRHEIGYWREKNIREAKRIYTELAEQGHAFSQYRLGLLLLANSDNFKSNIMLADYWLNTAAEQGVFDAQYYMADLN